MKKKINYGLIGYKGRLGSEVRDLFTESGHTLVYSSDLDGIDQNGNPDVIIDCSLSDAFNDNIKIIKKIQAPLIIAVTGLSDDNISSLKKMAESIPVVQSFNFSVGIQVLLNLAKTASSLLKDWDIEISEIHHRMKKDKPSGTAKMIKNIFKDRDVNVSSLRLGGVPGDHSVEFGGMGETLKITHHAISRRTFAEGILKSAEFILEKKNGFYTFTDVVLGK